MSAPGQKAKAIFETLSRIEERAGSVVEACEAEGISIGTYYKWRKRYQGMTVPQIRTKLGQPKRAGEAGACSAEELGEWQRRMGFTYVQAAVALGCAVSTYTEMIGGRTRIDRRTALACSAIENRIKPIGDSR